MGNVPMYHFEWILNEDKAEKGKSNVEVPAF